MSEQHQSEDGRIVGIHFQGCPYYYEGSLDAGAAADCANCTEIERAAGHGGHAVSRAEWDMGGDWDETFAWCEDCNVTAYPPPEACQI